MDEEIMTDNTINTDSQEPDEGPADEQQYQEQQKTGSYEHSLGDGTNLTRPATSPGNNAQGTSESLHLLGAGQAYPQKY
jgi:hypothetical protein